MIGQKRSMAIVAAGFGVGLLLAGCAVPGAPPSPQMVKGSEDGCESARADAGRPTHRIQDTQRMANDPAYAQGWQEGYQVCMMQAMRQNRRDDDD